MAGDTWVVLAYARKLQTPGAVVGYAEVTLQLLCSTDADYQIEVQLSPE